MSSDVPFRGGPRATAAPLRPAPSPAPARGLEHRLDAVLPAGHPVLAWLLALLAGWAALAVATIAAGLVLVDALLPAGLAGPDERLPAWLAGERTGDATTLSALGSAIGDLPVLPVLVAVAALACVVTRRYRAAAFVVGAGLVELATYRVASLVVERERPTVPRLDALPVDQSYPSGHVAASLAVYGAIGLILCASRPPRVRTAIWTLVGLAVLAVALSRMYRGMHHPLDVLAGLLVGLGALGVAAVAARAGARAAEVRR